MRSMRFFFIPIVACMPLALVGPSLALAEVPRELQAWFGQQQWQKAEQPIVSLGEPGAFDDRHIFAPAAAEEGGRTWLWYSGSRGSPGNRVFRLGLATSTD